jgi:murein DD-endopeptidase MepM/ murein hydrolase activator NlpD
MKPLTKWPTTLAVCALVGLTVVLLVSLAPPSSASLQSSLAAKQSAEQSLSQAVAADSGHIAALQGNISAVEARLAPIQARVDADQATLIRLQSQLRTARARLVALELRLQAADQALSNLLVAKYESDTPDTVTVILDSRGFADLLERVDFLKRVRNADSNIIQGDRVARTKVISEATTLGQLQEHMQRVTASILTQRNQIDRIRLALVEKQIQYEQARSVKSAKLDAARAQRQALESELAHIQAQSAAASGSGSSVGSGQISSGGGFTFPMPKGSASSPGSWSQDQGVDISAPGGTPLLAVGSGTIVLHGIGGFGPSAPVLHLDDGRYVYYGHAGPGNMLAIGTHVSAGQTISEVGSGIVGLSSGPHLEIGFSDGSGTPIGGTSGTMLALLHAAYGG